HQDNVDKGHNSYAHTPPFGKQRAKWSNSFNATETCFGNRGPMYKGDAEQGWTLLTGSGASDACGKNSNTLLIHGGRTTWEGNVGYNDSHVNFEVKPDPDALTYNFTGLAIGQRTKPDNIFVPEKDVDGKPAVDPTPGASGSFYTAKYTKDAFNLSGTAFLRPYATVTGTDSAQASIDSWVD
ncbi:MAG: hypothetical protein IT434_11830, partial [Phycisphaerales bacterium]|nr:hypothetical protein [Phycisphaerales bacterium]